MNLVPDDSQKARRRRFARGVVLVESLIVIGFTAFMLAAGIFFHRLYANKIYTMREARRKAWSEATPGCNGGVTGEMFGAALGIVDMLSDEHRRIDQDATLQDKSALAHAGMKDGATSSKADVPELLASWRGGFPSSYDVASKTRVPCNEKPEQVDANGVGIMKWGWDALVGGQP